MTANLVDIHLSDNSKLKAYHRCPIKFIHSDKQLTELSYQWAGEVHINNVSLEDILCVIDCIAYRSRHQENKKIIRLRTGGYVNPSTKKVHQYKLMAVIREKRIFVVTKDSDERVSDIAEHAPIRVTGVGHAYRTYDRILYDRRILFNEQNQNLA